MLRVLFCFFLLLHAFLSQGQDRCGTVEYEKLLQQKNPSRETKTHFESWIRDRMTQKLGAFRADRITSTNYVVPVVVHVIHNGETIGAGTNISDAQILSQIDVLNKDFNRLNADSVNTLNEFIPVAGKFHITFVMAKQDPNGDATTGINRVQGTKAAWSISDNYALKALSYWPAENYFNIWVTNLSGGLLGYTQLPVSSTLQGLDEASNDRLTDGVVVDYQAYGTSQVSGGSNFNLLKEYNLGRTATHEVGHFFGLRHVWGDVNSCDPNVSTDYVDDTPIQDTDYNGKCPSGAQVDCSGDAMYANYMNYTDDACMNIYTKGQVGRMDIVINNSPRRASLLTSFGAQAPSPVANDLELKAITTPGVTACSGSSTPQLVIRNFGSNTITTAKIDLSQNGSSVETKTFSSLSLSPNAEIVVSFNPVSLSAGTTTKFSFRVLQTNGTTDGRASNDTLSVVTMVPVSASLPLIEPFNGTPANWTIYNPDGLVKWQNNTIGSNGVMWLNFWNYENSGAIDRLITPVLDLSTASTASLSFDYAYATLSGGSNDRLRVLVSSNCDFNSAPVEIFNASGSTLATTTSYSTSFTPISSEWASKIFSLKQFLGQKIQIAFEGTNDYGNNLYIDNVSVLNNAVIAFSLNGVVSPSPVSCLSSVTPVISVKNLGNTVINSFNVDTYINNTKTSQLVSGAQIEVGASKNISLSVASFPTGSDVYSVVIKSPNGLTGGASTKDSLSTKRYISSAADKIPLRENFDANYESWTSTNPDFKAAWSPVSVSSSKNTSLVFDGFDNDNIGTQGWLVSPVMDFSQAKKASVFFETSYGYRSSASETLQVFYSTDCGEVFSHQVFSALGSSIKNADTNGSWTPTTDAKWTKQYINLDSLAGKENIRLAFVATNANGNNLYIDNIEFFTDDNRSPESVNGLYSIYGGTSTPLQVTFNLPERQLVRLQVYDIMGHIVSDELLQDTLNQTYTIDSSSHSTGVYIVRVQTQAPASLSSTKVLFGF